MSNVPDNETFSLQDVFSAVSSHSGGTSGNLTSCFNNAIFSYFDPQYNTNEYAPENSMLRFRNYTIGTENVSIQLLNVSQIVPDNLDFNVDKYNAVIRMTNNSSSTISCSFGVDMQFNTPIPSGQDDRGFTRIDVTPAYGELTGSGRVITLNRNAAVGNTDINIVITITNDNWDDSGFNRSFTLKVSTDTNSELGGTTQYTSTITGVKTCYWKITKNYSSVGVGNVLSYTIERYGSKPLGQIANCKDGNILETFNTGGYSSNKEFVQLYHDSNAYNYFGSSFTDNSTDSSTLTLGSLSTPPTYKARYALRNANGEFGISATFNHNMFPGNYTKFMDGNNNDISSIGHTSTVYSSEGYGHVVYLEDFSSNRIYLNAVPNGSSLSLFETFGVRFRVFGTGYVWYNGTPYYGGDVIYPDDSYFTSHVFRSNGTTDDLFIAGGMSNASTNTFGFSDYSTYLHLEANNGNIEINQLYPYIVGKAGIIQSE